MWGFFLRQKKGSCQRDACAACLIEAIGEHAVFRSAFDRSDITAVAERTLVTALVGVEALQGVSLVDGNAGGPRHVGPGCAAVIAERAESEGAAGDIYEVVVRIELAGVARTFDVAEIDVHRAGVERAGTADNAVDDVEVQMEGIAADTAECGPEDAQRRERRRHDRDMRQAYADNAVIGDVADRGAARAGSGAGGKGVCGKRAVADRDVRVLLDQHGAADVAIAGVADEAATSDLPVRPARRVDCTRAAIDVVVDVAAELAVDKRYW